MISQTRYLKQMVTGVVLGKAAIENLLPTCNDSGGKKKKTTEQTKVQETNETETGKEGKWDYEWTGDFIEHQLPLRRSAQWRTTCSPISSVSLLIVLKSRTVQDTRQSTGCQSAS